MPRNPALSEALALASSRRAECDATIAEATRALDNAESALSALGTAALIVDVRAQRDRWDAIAGELRRLVGDDAPTLPAGEQGKVCPKCDGAGHTGEVLYGNIARACRACNGNGTVEIR